MGDATKTEWHTYVHGLGLQKNHGQHTLKKCLQL